MNRKISGLIGAAALMVSAAGATLLIPSLVAAADPTAPPAATTAPAATSAPDNASGNPGTSSDNGATTPDSSTTTPGDCDGGPGGPHGGPGGLDADDLTAAASALGMSEADVTTALQSGQSLADIAQAQDVDVQKVIDAIVAADTAEIQAKVDDGTITQEQADQHLANLTAHVTNEVNGVRPAGMPGGPGGPGGPGRHGQPPAPPANDGTDSTTPTTTNSSGGTTS